MPLIRSRFVQFEGLVRFLGGNISINSGSSTSPSESVKLLEYGIVTALEDDDDFTPFQQKMSNGFYKVSETVSNFLALFAINLITNHINF